MKKQLGTAEGVFVIAILITLLMCPRLYAAEETLPTPEEIIAKNIEAIGGIKALNKIKNKKTVVIRKVEGMNKELKITQYKERPNNLLSIYDSGARVGSNGKIAWSIHPQNGARLLEGLELTIILSGAKFDRPDEPYKSMKTEGIEQINGKDCYKVVKTAEKGRETIEYYDKNTFMIVKTMSYSEGLQGNNKIEIYNEEYKKINGILFPYKEVHFINGQKNQEVTHEKIELNIEMPEGIFDIPEEVKAIMNKE